MMRTIMLVALFVALPDRPDPTPREKPKLPHEMLLGDWGVDGGTNAASIWRIMPTEAIWISGGVPMDGNGLTATYTIDWTKNPVTINLNPKRGGVAMPGILRLEGDRLIMALNTGGGQRPAQFENAPWIHTFHRIRQ